MQGGFIWQKSKTGMQSCLLAADMGIQHAWLDTTVHCTVGQQKYGALPFITDVENGKIVKYQ